MMSNTQFAFLKKSKVPSQGALQSSIDALGFDLKVFPDIKLLEDSGFSPCQLNGVDNVGFELFCEDSTSVTAGDEEFRAIAGDRDVCISFSWGGSLKDLACVMIVSCALVKDFDSVVSYEGEQPDSFADMLATTSEIIEDAMSEGNDESTSCDSEEALEHLSKVGISVGAKVSISGADGKKVDTYWGDSNYYDLNKRQMALMELWADGSITSKQRAELATVDAALFKLKNK